MSKEEHEEELKKQKSDDIKLAMAIEQSKKDSSDEVNKPFPAYFSLIWTTFCSYSCEFVIQTLFKGILYMAIMVGHKIRTI